MLLFPFAFLLIALCDWTMAQNLTTFVVYLAGDPELSTLSAAIAASGFNASELDTATFFAPTNDAFDRLDETLLVNLMQPGWIKHLENVLWMHITTIDAYTSDLLVMEDSLFELNTEELTVGFENGGNVTISSPNTNNSVVVEADIPVVEGIIHKIDQVLLPKFASTSLLDLFRSEGFSIFLELLTLSGLNAVLESDVVATVFAPTDDAFNALTDGALAYYRANIDITTSLLAGHVITNVVIPTSQMVDGPIVNKTAGMTTLTVSTEALDGTTTYKIGNATIGIADVLANNGIIHGIFSVLTVPGTEPPVAVVPPFADYLSNETDLSTLSAAIAASGFNASELDSATFFAPINDAFDKLNETLLANLMQPGWIKHLENVVLMHITTIDAYISDLLVMEDSLFELNTEEITVSFENGGNVSISSPNTNNSVVVEADIAVVEGIIHKVDQVLLPQFASTSLVDLVGGDGFSILTELLTLSGLNAVLESDVIATVFAPTDDAFNALKDGTLEYYRENLDVVTALLAGHVIANVVLPTSLMVDGPIANETAGMTTLTVRTEALDGTTIYQIDNATIGVADVLANNGIIHGITAVLAVPGTEYTPPTKPTAPTSPSPAVAPVSNDTTTATVPVSPITAPTTAPMNSDIPIGAVIGGVVVLGVAILSGSLIYLHRKRNNEPHKRSTLPSGGDSGTSAELPPSNRSVIPSVFADPVMGHPRATENPSSISNVPYAAVATIPETETNVNRVSYKDQCRPASATQPAATAPPISEPEEDHRVSYKDQCQDSSPPSALPVVRVSEPVHAIDRDDSIPFAVAVAVAPPSSYIRPQEPK